MGDVLVVEDDHAICEIICEALRDASLAVDCVTTDIDAYGRITSLPTLLGLVVDVNLGKGTTGYDVARFARQVIPDVRVVYISSEAAPHSFKAFGVPDSVFVQKPITPAELVGAVKRKLSDTQA